MSQPITIAHLTDLHIGPIAGFSPRHWNVKRAIGYINWLRNRKSAFQRAVLDRIVDDMRRQAPDHVVVTGDLVNIGLPQEHINALAWLESLGPPERVTVIPGNHDIYARLWFDPGTRRWSRYMQSDPAGAGYVEADAPFPFVRLVGGVALIGVNSAVPTPPAVAWGRTGKRQIARLAALLERLGNAGLFRLMMIHHPPLPGQARRLRALLDAARLQAVLERVGAELVIHGHNHHNMLAWVPRPSGPLPVVGAPSASLGKRYKSEPLARYNLYRIDLAGGTIDLIGRGLAETGGPIVELERRALSSQI